MSDNSPQEKPPIVGCYTLDIYCTSGREHAYGKGHAQFTGRTETECIRDARAGRRAA